MISATVKDLITADEYTLQDIRQGMSIFHNHDHLIFHPGCEEIELMADDILVVSLHRLLLYMGFGAQHVRSIIEHFKDQLIAIGLAVGDMRKVPVMASTLQIIDYRWAILDGGIWNFVDYEVSAPPEVPLTSIAIGLPVAVYRAVGKTAKLLETRSKAEEMRADREQDGSAPVPQPPAPEE